MVESQDLELVAAVVRTGTLRGAGEATHLTQPAVTRRIQSLERRVGVRLFHRVGRRLELTEAGEEFTRRAGEILSRIEDLEGEMRAFGRGQRGVLRIGATATVCLYLLAPVLEEMRRAYPQYELFLFNETSRRMPELVREGAVDVGIASVGAPAAALQTVPWRQLHLGLLSRSSFGSTAVSIRELNDAPLVMNSPGSLRTAVEEALRTYDVTPRMAAQADSLEVVRMLVACGFGHAVTPLEVMKEDAARSGLTLSPFREALAPLPVACFFRRTSPPLRALLDLIKRDQ